ncbi:hypothetical protein [Streptomyces sp. NPDC048256]|uniref:effector-associated constant component EACC1 n=1 Tax=Streptomyces sp. NPDC048256 TaxID=3154613 RepID=UPI0034022212
MPATALRPEDARKALVPGPGTQRLDGTGAVRQAPRHMGTVEVIDTFLGQGSSALNLAMSYAAWRAARPAAPPITITVTATGRPPRCLPAQAGVCAGHPGARGLQPHRLRVAVTGQVVDLGPVQHWQKQSPRAAGTRSLAPAAR